MARSCIVCGKDCPGYYARYCSEGCKGTARRERQRTKPPCIMPACECPQWNSRGFCQLHYGRLSRIGALDEPLPDIIAWEIGRVIAPILNPFRWSPPPLRPRLPPAKPRESKKAYTPPQGHVYRGDRVRHQALSYLGERPE